MRQTIQKDSLKFKLKTEQVECPKHKKHIHCFNIGQDVQQGDRLICEDCPSAGNYLVFPNQAEDYLYSWYQAEQIQIEQEEQKLKNLICLLSNSIEDKKKDFLKQIQILTNQLKQFADIFQNYISNLYETNLNNFINQISTQETLSQSLLQNLAEFISEQTIQPGKIIFKDVIDIKLKRQYMPLEQTLKMIKQIQQTVQNQQSSIEFQQFIKEFYSISDFLKYKDPIELKGHQVYIFSVAISHDDKLIASGDIKGLIILWDLLKRIQIKQYQEDDKKSINHLIFSKDKQYLAVASSASDILLFNLIKNTQSPQIRLKGHSNSVNRIQFTANSNYLLSGSSDKTLIVWQVDQSSEISTLTLSSSVKGVSLSQNEQMIACGCEKGEAYIFNSKNITTLKLLTKWETQETQLRCTILTPDSQKVITGHKGVIKIWAIDSLLSTNQQHPLKILKLEYSDDIYDIETHFNGSLLINNSQFVNNEINFWNVDTGLQVQFLCVPKYYNKDYAFQFKSTSNMRYIVTGASSELQIYERIEQ